MYYLCKQYLCNIYEYNIYIYIYIYMSSSSSSGRCRCERASGPSVVGPGRAGWPPSKGRGPRWPNPLAQARPKVAQPPSPSPAQSAPAPQPKVGPRRPSPPGQLGPGDRLGGRLFIFCSGVMVGPPSILLVCQTYTNM